MNRQYLKPTPILDYDNPKLAQAVEEIFASSEHEFLQKAYLDVMQRVYPIYNIDELQSASVTLEKGIGSCTQRTALVEAMARAVGIATRIQVLWIKGEFWYPRFPRWTYPFIPKRIMLLWPEFYIENEWLDFSEVIAPLETLTHHADTGFTNYAETIYDAIAVRPVDFDNKLSQCECGDQYDLSHQVLGSGGYFTSRDEALANYGSFQHSPRGIAFQIMFAGKTLPIADPKLIAEQIYPIPANTKEDVRIAG